MIFPHSLNIEKIDTLVFSGGGVKGFVFLGACHMLTEIGIFKNIKTFCGTSTGAMCSLILSMGYTPKDVYDVLIEIEFSSIPNFSENILACLTEKFGISKSNKITEILKVFLKKKGHGEEISFLELYNKTGKHLIITGTCLNTQEAFIMDYKNTPSMGVLDSIRISINVPIFFEACSHEGMTYVDGGASIHYPISLFNDSLDTTLGFYLSRENEFIPSIDSLEKYFLTIYYSIWSSSIKLYSTLYKNNTIFIPCSVNMLNFKLSKEKKWQMFSTGYRKTAEFVHKNLYQKTLCNNIKNWKGFNEKKISIKNIIKEGGVGGVGSVDDVVSGDGGVDDVVVSGDDGDIDDVVSGDDGVDDVVSGGGGDGVSIMIDDVIVSDSGEDDVCGDNTVSITI